MNRREFLGVAGSASVAPLVRSSAAAIPQPSPKPQDDRAVWVDRMRRVADPVLKQLGSGTLKARMPVEQASGSDRRGVTHLEALGRLVAGIAPWIELAPDDTPEG